MAEHKIFKIELSDYEMGLIQKCFNDCSKIWAKSKDIYKKSESSYSLQLSNWFEKQLNG